MTISNGLRIYDGAEFAHALQAEMDSAPGEKDPASGKTLVKRELSPKRRASAFASKLREAIANAIHSKPGAGIDDMMVVLVETRPSGRQYVVSSSTSPLLSRLGRAS